MASTVKDILPDTVKPVNYDISLYDLELGGAYSYQGTVDIALKIQKATKDIVINSHQLVLHSAEISVEHTKLQQSVKASDISYDAAKQRATLTFPEELPESNKANLVIKFQGTMNNDMAGFYRSKYKPAVEPAASVPFDGEHHYMFSTQFESSDARRAFPCFDEPNLKATFDFEVELPKDQVALSNMPEKGTREGKNGRQVVSFERTPVMSTYLLAWAVGDFEYIEEFTERKYNGKHLPCRVYTTKGLKEQARFALEHAHKIVDYYSDVFEIEYPLPKADLLAVHEFSHGAMENWGLVTYRTTAVLFDEKNSNARYKRYVAYVVAHELAHQWFGNLVTMDWWSELWLNEGFATWVGWLATNHFHPEWDVWPFFVSDSMQMGFTLDGLRSSHPIEVPVKDALEVDQIFDHISYRKGSSVIRMLAGHLGNDVFLRGVAKYLKAHAYGNATTDDLWSALSETSGQDVNALMDNWIRKIGFPVVSVKENGNQISVKQSRYLSTGDVKAEDDTTTWWIPLGIKGQTGVEGVASVALQAKEDTVSNIDSDFYKLNADTTGFFRTAYPADRLAKLGKQLSKLSTADKIGLLADAGALAMSGEISTSGLLGFTENFSNEENYITWAQAIANLDVIKSVFREDEEVNKGLNAFTLKLIDRAVKEIGWEFKEGEEFLTGQLRVLLIGAATTYGQKEANEEAIRQFQTYISGNQDAVNPSLRSVVFQTAIRNSNDSSAYDALLKEWHETTTIDGKDLALSALGRVQSPELIENFLKFTFTEVRIQDVHSSAIALAASPVGRAALWDFIKKNFDMIHSKLSGNMVVLERFLRVSLQKFSSFEVDEDIKQFFANKDTRGYDRGLAQVSDTIRARAEYKTRDAEAIKGWFKENGYLA